MTATPNRISAFQPLSPGQELAFAHELLSMESEEEVDRFLPLILPALKLAAPLLTNVAGSLLGGLGGGRRPRRPRNQQEYFLGNIVKGLLGEMPPENEEEQQFLGNIFKGLLGEQELSGEEEQFLGGIVSKLLGRRRRGELEAGGGGDYVQEQFLGGIIGKLLGGRRELEAEMARQEEEAEEETATGRPSPRRIRLARRFVRMAHFASRRAARRLAQLGRRAHPEEARRIVLGSIIGAARRMAAHRAARHALPGDPPPPQPRALPPAPPDHPEPQQGAGAGPPNEGEASMLELMLASPVPPAFTRRASPPGQGRWILRGGRVVFSV